MITDPAASDGTEPGRSAASDDGDVPNEPHIPNAAANEPATSAVTGGDEEQYAQPPAPRHQAVLGGLVIGGAAVTGAIPTTFPAGGGPTAFDQTVREPVDTVLDPRPWVAEVLALASNSWVVLALLLAGVGWFAWQRRWRETATMAVVPELAVSLNTWVLKPWWGRPLHDYLAYPSGHTVHLIAVATTFVLLVGTARARIILVLLTLVAWTVAGIGTVALDYHLPTDIVGGASAAITLSAGLYWISLEARDTWFRQRMR